jgi:hypothetical protein
MLLSAYLDQARLEHLRRPMYGCEPATEGLQFLYNLPKALIFNTGLYPSLEPYFFRNSSIITALDPFTDPALMNPDTLISNTSPIQHQFRTSILTSESKHVSLRLDVLCPLLIWPPLNLVRET